MGYRRAPDLAFLRRQRAQRVEADAEAEEPTTVAGASATRSPSAAWHPCRGRGTPGAVFGRCQDPVERRAGCPSPESADRVRRIGATASITSWLEDPPLAALAIVVFALTFLAATLIYISVMALAVGKRGEAFKAFSPGMLPPMGLLFALIVGFLAAQVWSDAGRAQEAVNREASALRSIALLAHAFPGEPEARIDTLLRRQIREAVDEEWPAMSHQRATLTVIPAPLAEALHSLSVSRRARKARRRRNARS